jgi:release factor glutamine methyltransferase
MTLAQALSLWHKNEALHLLSHITGLTHTDIILHGERRLTDADVYLSMLKQRENHVPLQYILGKWEFMGITFKTDPRALIPRPETELLAETVIQASPARVLDACTGGGCLAVSIAKLTRANVVATDLCADALALARENAALHGVTDQITFLQGDLLEALPPDTGLFDAIVSNPPYIPTREMGGLQAEVKNHEPHKALDGGADGLAFYRRLIPQSTKWLRPGGALYLELGPREGVARLMRQSGFLDIQTLCDYAGISRILIGKGNGQSGLG